MKDETGGISVKKFVWYPKINSFLVDDSSEHKKAKSVNNYVVEKITHSKCNDNSLNIKWFDEYLFW